MLFSAQLFDIVSRHLRQPTVNLDAHHSGVRHHSGDQQCLPFAGSKIDECPVVREMLQHEGERGPLASEVRPVLGTCGVHVCTSSRDVRRGDPEIAIK